MLCKQRLEPQHFGIIILQLLLQGMYLVPKFSVFAIELRLEFTNGVQDTVVSAK
jgi:hypothetical protein